MPVALEGVALALDVVSEGGAFGEGMVLLLDERRVLLREDGELGQGSCENLRVLGSEDGLSLAGNEEMGSAPEGVDLGGHGGKSDSESGCVHAEMWYFLVENFNINYTVNSAC